MVISRHMAKILQPTGLNHIDAIDAQAQTNSTLMTPSKEGITMASRPRAKGQQ